MTVKLVTLIRRRADLTSAEFRDYYENVHVPLITRLLPFWADYRRNFLEDAPQQAGHQAGGRPAERPFDVITELTYADDAMRSRVTDALSDPRIGGIIAEDEARFMDRASMQTFVVDERISLPDAG